MAQYLGTAGWILLRTMVIDNSADSFETLSSEEKKIWLYNRQKEILDGFLQRGAISRAQHDKSLGDMAEKMEISL